jgi:pilus assembly protein FimV
MKHPVKVLPLAMALAFIASDAHALGLGTLEVKSQLNQPLVAEIPLIGVGPGELDALSVRLAPPEAFDRVGLPRPAGVTANLQFSVGRNARGEPVVRVTTSNRVDDPFVAFLLGSNNRAACTLQNLETRIEQHSETIPVPPAPMMGEPAFVEPPPPEPVMGKIAAPPRPRMGRVAPKPRVIMGDVAVPERPAVDEDRLEVPERLPCECV